MLFVRSNYREFTLKGMLTAVTVLELPRKARGEEGIGRVQSCIIIIIIIIIGGWLTLCTYQEKKNKPRCERCFVLCSTVSMGKERLSDEII